MGPYLVTAIKNADDENCGRFACGLISDLANYMEKGISQYASEFMPGLQEVLTQSEFTTETKLTAMIAVGDLCLAIEEDFKQYLDSTMKCLLSACAISL